VLGSDAISHDFTLPDLQGRSVVGRGARASGVTGGAEQVRLTEAQVGHGHRLQSVTGDASSSVPTNSLFAPANGTGFYSSVSSSVM
jgi:microcystin-dependent protein